jgi:hypothetical protein
MSRKADIPLAGLVRVYVFRDDPAPGYGRGPPEVGGARHVRFHGIGTGTIGLPGRDVEAFEAFPEVDRVPLRDAKGGIVKFGAQGMTQRVSQYTVECCFSIDLHDTSRSRSDFNSRAGSCPSTDSSPASREAKVRNPPRRGAAIRLRRPNGPIQKGITSTPRIFASGITGGVLFARASGRSTADPPL